MTDTFIQRPTPEPIQAFQAVLDDGEGPDEVLEAFGLGIEDDWTLKNTNGKFSLSFARPASVSSYARVESGGIWITLNGTTGETVPTSTTVNDGDWIVTKYYDTDYPEVSVLTDVAFQRQYQPDWFLNASIDPSDFNI